MNRNHQLWTLLKFHLSTNPALWVIPFYFAMQFFLIGFNSFSTLSLSTHITIYNWFLVYVFAPNLLAPEMGQSWGRKNPNASTGDEFLLTRAIDRPFVYRSRAILLYLMILGGSLVCLLYSFKQPNLTIQEFSKVSYQECLKYLPNSVAQPALNNYSMPAIFIPWGQVLVASWQAWFFIISAFGTQILLMIISPLKGRAVIFWVILMAVILSPLIFLSHSHDKDPSYTERLFFAFSSHQVLFWILTIFAALITTRWCERRFASLEH